MGDIPPDVVAESGGDFEQLFLRSVIQDFMKEFSVL
jgi:hypothetical protein